MTERMRSPRSVHQQDNDGKLGPKKTAIVFVVVVGCFAVLWPKVFYPMLKGSANHHIKPSPIDRQSGCCDVISELDMKTIKIMSELCGSIIKQSKEEPLTNKEVLMKCRSAVLETCGIDISAVLQEQVRLGQSVKQIIDEVRSLNGSLCLKYNFGVAPWRLGVPHRIITNPPVDNIRQERPLHLRSEMVHPAFRERGRAIPQAQSSSLPPKPPARLVPGRPGPIPGLRPTIGGAGHVVPSKQQSVGGPMGLIMPIYTIAIVAFFSYTVIKLFTKKKPEVGDLYPRIEPDPVFRREVYESQRAHPNLREGISSKLGDLELDHLRRRLRETEEAMERIYAQLAKVPLKKDEPTSTGNLSNGNAVIPEEDEQPTVKVMGLEVTASCEGDKKWSGPGGALPNAASPQAEELPPPQEIFLEGALPAQSHLLVADSTTKPEPESGENDSVVLASKMTLSVISLDSSENGTDESSSDKKSDPMVVVEDDDLKGSSNGSDDFEKIEADQLEEQINDIIQEAKHITDSQIPMEIERSFLELEKTAPDAEKHEHATVENKDSNIVKKFPILTDVKHSHPVQGQLVKEISGKEVIKCVEDDEKTVNVEEIYEVEEIVEIEQKPVVLDIPLPSKEEARAGAKETEQLDEKDKIADKTKSSASSGTVEDIEELLSRDDEVDEELNGQIDYEGSDNGSEGILDEVRNTDRISEERDEIDELLGKYGSNDDEDISENEDEIVDVQEIVEYVDEEEEELNEEQNQEI